MNQIPIPRLSNPRMPRINNLFIPTIAIQSLGDIFEKNQLENAQRMRELSTPRSWFDPWLNQRVRDYYAQQYQQTTTTEIAGRLFGAAEGAGLGAGIGGVIGSIVGFIAGGGAGAVPGATLGMKIGASIGGTVGVTTSDYTTYHASMDLINNTIIESFKNPGRGLLNSLMTLGTTMDQATGATAIKAGLSAAISGENAWDEISHSYGLGTEGRKEMDFSEIREELGIDTGWGLTNFVIDMVGELLTDPGAIGSIGASIVSTGAKKAVQGAIIKQADDVAKGVSEVAQKLSKSDELIDQSKGFLNRIAKNILDGDDIALKTALDQRGKIFTPEQLKVFIAKIKTEATKEASNKVYNLFKALDKTDDFITAKLFKYTTAPGLSVQIIKGYSFLDKHSLNVIGQINEFLTNKKMIHTKKDVLNFVNKYEFDILDDDEILRKSRRELYTDYQILLHRAESSAEYKKMIAEHDTHLETFLKHLKEGKYEESEKLFKQLKLTEAALVSKTHGHQFTILRKAIRQLEDVHQKFRLVKSMQPSYQMTITNAIAKIFNIITDKNVSDDILNYVYHLKYNNLFNWVKEVISKDLLKKLHTQVLNDTLFSINDFIKMSEVERLRLISPVMFFNLINQEKSFNIDLFDVFLKKNKAKKMPKEAIYNKATTIIANSEEMSAEATKYHAELTKQIYDEFFSEKAHEKLDDYQERVYNFILDDKEMTTLLPIYTTESHTEFLSNFITNTKNTTRHHSLINNIIDVAMSIEESTGIDTPIFNEFAKLAGHNRNEINFSLFFDEDDLDQIIANIESYLALNKRYQPDVGNIFAGYNHYTEKQGLLVKLKELKSSGQLSGVKNPNSLWKDYDGDTHKGLRNLIYNRGTNNWVELCENMSRLIDLSKNYNPKFVREQARILYLRSVLDNMVNESLPGEMPNSLANVRILLDDMFDSLNGVDYNKDVNNKVKQFLVEHNKYLDKEYAEYSKQLKDIDRELNFNKHILSPEKNEANIILINTYNRQLIEIRRNISNTRNGVKRAKLEITEKEISGKIDELKKFVVSQEKSLEVAELKTTRDMIAKTMENIKNKYKPSITRQIRAINAEGSRSKAIITLLRLVKEEIAHTSRLEFINNNSVLLKNMLTNPLNNLLKKVDNQINLIKKKFNEGVISKKSYDEQIDRAIKLRADLDHEIVFTKDRINAFKKRLILSESKLIDDINQDILDNVLLEELRVVWYGMINRDVNIQLNKSALDSLIHKEEFFNSRVFTVESLRDLTISIAKQDKLEVTDQLDRLFRTIMALSDDVNPVGRCIINLLVTLNSVISDVDRHIDYANLAKHMTDFREMMDNLLLKYEKYMFARKVKLDEYFNGYHVLNLQSDGSLVIDNEELKLIYSNEKELELVKENIQEIHELFNNGSTSEFTNYLNKLIVGTNLNGKVPEVPLLKGDTGNNSIYELMSTFDDHEGLVAFLESEQARDTGVIVRTRYAIDENGQPIEQDIDINKATFVIFDTETDRRDFGNTIQLAGFIVRPNQEPQRFEYFLDIDKHPNINISEKTQSIHHISNQVLKEQKKAGKAFGIEDILHQLNLQINDPNAIFIGHNVGYDIKSIVSTIDPQLIEKVETDVQISLRGIQSLTKEEQDELLEDMFRKTKVSDKSIEDILQKHFNYTFVDSQKLITTLAVPLMLDTSVTGATNISAARMLNKMGYFELLEDGRRLTYVNGKPTLVDDSYTEHYSTFIVNDRKTKETYIVNRDDLTKNIGSLHDAKIDTEQTMNWVMELFHRPEINGLKISQLSDYKNIVNEKAIMERILGNRYNVGEEIDKLNSTIKSLTDDLKYALDNAEDSKQIEDIRFKLSVFRNVKEYLEQNKGAYILRQIFKQIMEFDTRMLTDTVSDNAVEYFVKYDIENLRHTLKKLDKDIFEWDINDISDVLEDINSILRIIDDTKTEILQRNINTPSLGKIESLREPLEEAFILLDNVRWRYEQTLFNMYPDWNKLHYNTALGFLRIISEMNLNEDFQLFHYIITGDTSHINVDAIKDKRILIFRNLMEKVNSVVLEVDENGKATKTLKDTKVYQLLHDSYAKLNEGRMFYNEIINTLRNNFGNLLQKKNNAFDITQQMIQLTDTLLAKGDLVQEADLRDFLDVIIDEFKLDGKITNGHIYLDDIRDMIILKYNSVYGKQTELIIKPTSKAINTLFVYTTDYFLSALHRAPHFDTDTVRKTAFKIETASTGAEATVEVGIMEYFNEMINRLRAPLNFIKDENRKLRRLGFVRESALRHKTGKWTSDMLSENQSIVPVPVGFFKESQYFKRQMNKLIGDLYDESNQIPFMEETIPFKNTRLGNIVYKLSTLVNAKISDILKFTEFIKQDVYYGNFILSELDDIIRNLDGSLTPHQKAGLDSILLDIDELANEDVLKYIKDKDELIRRLKILTAYTIRNPFFKFRKVAELYEDIPTEVYMPYLESISKVFNLTSNDTLGIAKYSTYMSDFYNQLLEDILNTNNYDEYIDKKMIQKLYDQIPEFNGEKLNLILGPVIVAALIKSNPKFESFIKLTTFTDSNGRLLRRTLHQAGVYGLTEEILNSFKILGTDMFDEESIIRYFSQNSSLRLVIDLPGKKGTVLRQLDIKNKNLLHHVLENREKYNLTIMNHDDFIRVTNQIEPVELPPIVNFLRSTLLVPMKILMIFNLPYLINNFIEVPLKNYLATENLKTTITDYAMAMNQYYKFKNFYDKVTSNEDLWVKFRNLDNINKVWINELERNWSQFFPNEVYDAELIKLLKHVQSFSQLQGSSFEFHEFVRNLKVEQMKIDFYDKLKTKINNHEKLTPEEATHWYIINDKPNGYNAGIVDNKPIVQYFDSLEEERDYLKNLVETGQITSQAQYQRYYHLLTESTIDDKIKYIYKMFNIFKVQQFLNISSNWEIIGRLALYNRQLIEGATKSEAAEMLMKYHFIYSNKSAAEKYAEFIVPFITYPVKTANLFYELMQDHKVAKLITSFTKYSWGDRQYEDSDYLVNRKMKGDILLSDTTALSVGLPFYDALRTMGSPHEALNNKVNPLFKPLIDLANGSEYNRWNGIPGISQGRSYVQMYQGIQQGGLQTAPINTLFPSVTNEYYKQQVYNQSVKRIYPQQFYKNLYTQSGYSRIQMRMQKTTLQNLPYRVNDIMYTFRNMYNR